MIAPTSTANAPIFAIVIHEKGGAERREAFETSEISVGRVQGNELMLPKGNVSKRHARLLYRDGRFIVTDLNSTNGTYVNRRRITQATIVREGDRIYIGDFVLRIEPTGEGAAVPAEERSGQALLPRASNPERTSSSGAPHRATEEEVDLSRVPAPPHVPGTPSSASPSHSELARLNSVDPQEPTGTHPIGRTTQEDRDERHVAREAVRSLVMRAAVSLDASADQAPDSGQAARVDELLRGALAALGEARELPSNVSVERLLQHARAELLEYGPLGELLLDSSVSEIGVSRFDRVIAVRSGKPTQLEFGFSCELTLRWAIQRLCAASGQPLDPSETVVERHLEHGLRVSAVLGDATWSGGCLLLRRSHRAGATLEDLVRRGAISRAIATFLQQCLSGRVNMLVVGARDGGVDLLMSALAAASSDAPSVWISDVEIAGEPCFNLGVAGRTGDSNPLNVIGQLPGTRLFAELTTAEVTAAVVESITDGTDGVVAARYAPSLRRAMMRMPAELAAARPGVSADVARDWAASAFEIVIEVARLRDERHRVLRIAEVTGVQGGEITAVDVFTFVMDRTAAGGAIEGTFTASGVIPAVIESMRARGAALESSIFSRPPTR